MAGPLDFWENIASAWDKDIGEDGNDYWTYLQEPALRRMVESTAGEQALDLASGNGIVARWLAREGADVLAMDGSQKMIELAAARTIMGVTTAGSIRFQRLNLIDNNDVDEFTLAQLERLPQGLDVITVNMAIMDFGDLQPLAKLASRLLKPRSGRLVVTLLHPFFFTNNATRSVEIDEDATGERQIVSSIKVKEYLHVPPHKARLYLASVSSDDIQTVFHRPLHELLAPFFAEGLMLDALEEPNFDESFVDDARPHGSKSFTQVPKILAFRLRKIASQQ